MGLNIREIIPRREIEISDLKGKVVCVDAFNTLYQFLSSIRQMDGTPLMDNKKRITSHLSGIFYRNLTLLEHGIKLVYVFDGIPPEQKFATAKIRREGRELAKDRYEQAREEEQLDAMKRYGSQLVRINEDIIRESKELLEAMGIAVVQAPSEGEAQAAYLAKSRSDIYASASQDYDSLLFAAPNLIRNLTLARKRKTISGWIEVKPEIIELEKVLNYLEINLDQLICLGILVGTDYNPKGIPGIGQKKALQIVKRFKQPILIFDSMKEQIANLADEDKFDWREIFELFHKPNVSNSLFKFDKVNEKKIREILVEEHDFSDDRVQKQLERLRDITEKNKQKGLDKWF
jgi:flap endonuclease-1